MEPKTTITIDGDTITIQTNGLERVLDFIDNLDIKCNKDPEDVIAFINSLREDLISVESERSRLSSNYDAVVRNNEAIRRNAPSENIVKEHQALLEDKRALEKFISEDMGIELGDGPNDTAAGRALRIIQDYRERLRENQQKLEKRDKEIRALEQKIAHSIDILYDKQPLKKSGPQ